MDSYVTGGTIRALRDRRGLTQKALADKLAVSDKTVSKWETSRGLPDLSLLEPLGAALGVSIPELLNGEQVINRNRAGNPRRGKRPSTAAAWPCRPWRPGSPMRTAA